jgi:hypothetical protein
LGKPINYGRWNRKDDMRNWTITEEQARQSAICVGCGQTTDCPGGVVCWACFKGGPNPLRYFGGTFAAWQAGLPELNEEPFRVLRHWERGWVKAVGYPAETCKDVAVSVKWKGEGIMGGA